MIVLVPWTIWNSEHALGGYCIRHQGESTGKWILLASNRIRKTISRSSSSSDPQSQLSTFAPITNRLQISNCWKVEALGYNHPLQETGGFGSNWNFSTSFIYCFLSLVFFLFLLYWNDSIFKRPLISSKNFPSCANY